jgi:carbonic anhydrase
MASINKTFATIINCMDGRVQKPSIDWLKKEFSVDYVDDITIPGPDKIISENTSEHINLIKEELKISTQKHGSRIIAIEGHYDCAGNPVDEATHKQNVRDAVDHLKSWEPNAQVVGLYIGSDWKVERVV